jgi:high affinity Mn2+ porin
VRVILLPRHLAALSRMCLLIGAMLAAAPARAEDGEAEAGAGDTFRVMNLLARHDLHEFKNERWNAYGQMTYISSWKLPFPAPYTGLNGSTNSLSPNYERSFTGTATAFLGVRLWRGAELFIVPEVIIERPLSRLAGLGGVIQNAELQKSGGESPTPYLSRVYLSQTFGFGGHPVEKTSDPMQLGHVVDSRRLVLTAGNFSILDFFDKNSFTGDLRRQFLNMAFLTYAAYDFAADARGYTWGAVAEYYHDAWAFRIARIASPHDPNQLPIDFRIYEFYGDQIEIEHAHKLLGQDGVVRVLGYRNRENMGRFDDALAAFRADRTKNATTCASFNYGSANAGAPDLCWARRPNVKVGVGINLEQRITNDIGVFFRGMISDGQTEVYSFTSTDSSLSLGVLAAGSLWRRPHDLTGVAYGQGWISKPHADYLNAGGIDGFIGDGKLNQASERVIEIFYSFNVIRSLWVSADYQHISNPAYNADRGPVDIFGARIHAEF